MKGRKTLIFTVTFLMFTLVFSTMALAFPGNLTALPPGLQKKAEVGKTLPPPFQNSNIQHVATGSIEGEIIMIRQLAGQTWIIVEGQQEIKALKLNHSNTYSLNSKIRAQYQGDTITAIQLINSGSPTEGVLEYEFSANPQNVVVGEKVEFNLKVTNPGTQNVRRQFNSTQRVEFVVKKDNETIWQSSDGYFYGDVMQNISFIAGRTVDYSEHWYPNVPGTYIVEAYFLGESRTSPVARKEIIVSQEKTELTYRLDITPRIVRVGNEMTFTLNIKNDQNNIVTKDLTSGQVYDFVVKKDGNQVWRWSNGKGFTMQMGTITFKPGEVLGCAEKWTPSSTGNYIVEAYFLGENTNPVVTREFRVIR